MNCQTYRATVRKGGLHTSSRRINYDFIEDMTTPMTFGIAQSWECAFGDTIPTALSRHNSDCVQLLTKLHNAFKAKANQNGVTNAEIQMRDIKPQTTDTSSCSQSMASRRP